MNIECYELVYAGVGRRKNKVAIGCCCCICKQIGQVLLTRCCQVLLAVPEDAKVFVMLLGKVSRACCDAQRMCCGTQCQQGQGDTCQCCCCMPQHTAYAMQMHAAVSQT
jgi:hypothetical protein